MLNSNFKELNTVVKPSKTTFIVPDGIARATIWTKTKAYGSGSLVLHEGYLYAALEAVDTNIDIANTKYWKPLTYPYEVLNNNINKLRTEFDSHIAKYDQDKIDAVEYQKTVNRQLKNLYDGKLDKITDAYQIYATGKNGEQKSYRFSSAGLPETIMFREWGSGTCNIVDPIEPLNIANKKYVDTALDTKLDFNDAAKTIQLSIDKDYKLKAQLCNSDGKIIGGSNVIDLPIESLIVNVSYDASSKDLVITLQNDEVLYVPLDALIEGLATTSDLKGKLDKITDAYQIYGTDKNGEQRSYKFSSAGLPETIMFREWGSGTCNIVDPIEPLNIANKKYVDDGLSRKVAKKTAADNKAATGNEVLIYGISSDGTECVFKGSGLAEYGMAGTFPIRGTNGLLYSPDIPETNTNKRALTNRAYVDDGLRGKVNKITNTGGFYKVYAVDLNGVEDNRKIAVNDDNIGRGAIPSYQINNVTDYGKQDGIFVLATGTPKNPYHCANKAYVDTELNKKVNRVNKENIIYGTGLLGIEATYSTGSSAKSGNIQTMCYTPNGGYNNNGQIDTTITGTYMVGIPDRPGHATPKKYVDDGLSGKVDKVDPTTLVNRLCAYVVDPRNADRKVLAIENEAQCRIGNIAIYNDAADGNKPNGAGVLLTNTPTKPYQCANQLYVDAQKTKRHLVEFKTSENAPPYILSVESTSATPFTSLSDLPDNVPLIAINSGDGYAKILQKYGDRYYEIRYASGSWKDGYGNISDYIFASDTVTEL